MKSLLDILKATSIYLEQKGFDHSRREAEELISRALDISRMQLYLDFDRPLTEQELSICRSFLLRRLTGEPHGYISGKQSFLNCSLLVSSSVLIPRQETEILADKIVSSLKKESLENKSLLDLCCGSGCLGLAIKKELPDLCVTLSDISSDALHVARQNGKLNDLEVMFVQGDLLEPFNGQTFDFVVCNPPYISAEAYETLDREVKNFEPRGALLAGPRGTEFYEKLAFVLPSVLRPGGKVWFEIGFDQGESVPQLFSNPCWKNKVVLNDWSDQNRFFFLEIE